MSGNINRTEFDQAMINQFSPPRPQAAPPQLHALPPLPPARDGNQPYGNATTQAPRAAFQHPSIAAAFAHGTLVPTRVLMHTPDSPPLAIVPAAPAVENLVPLVVQQESPSASHAISPAPAVVQAALPQAAATASLHNALVQFNGDIINNEDIIKNAPVTTFNKNQKTALRNLGRWLVKYNRGNLNDILNSGQSAYGNPNVQDWLDAPGKENPYGHNGACRAGEGAVTALLKAYDKPH